MDDTFLTEKVTFNIVLRLINTLGNCVGKKINKQKPSLKLRFEPSGVINKLRFVSRHFYQTSRNINMKDTEFENSQYNIFFHIFYDGK